MTIKDIADKAGVSIGSVHCALSGKAGVGEETRRRILEVARQYDYRPNSAAASLKRKALRIAAVFPGPSEDNRFYFPYIWEGFHDYMRTVGDFNIEVTEVPYYKDVNSIAEEIRHLLERKEIDGMSIGYLDDRFRFPLELVSGREIPYVLIGNDLPGSRPICCVQPNYRMIGEMMAEQIARQIPKEGGILLCAGGVMIPSHYLVVQGFEAYLWENGCDIPVYKTHTDAIEREAYDHIVHDLMRSGIAACASVTARSSVMLARALRETGKAGSIPAIGSDMFAENMENLRSGVLTNLVNKNPHTQAYVATRYLVDYLLRDTRPLQETVFVGSEMVFKSNLPMYEKGFYRLLT